LTWALKQVIDEENKFQLSILFCASNNNSIQFSPISISSIYPRFERAERLKREDNQEERRVCRAAMEPHCTVKKGSFFQW